MLFLQYYEADLKNKLTFSSYKSLFYDVIILKSKLHT